MNDYEHHIGDFTRAALDDEETALHRADLRSEEGYCMRPLSATYRPALRMMRPGALDYRTISSRMGEQLVAHGEKAVA